MKAILTVVILIVSFFQLFANNHDIKELSTLCNSGDEVACTDIELISEGITTERDRLLFLKQSCESGMHQFCEMVNMEKRRYLSSRYTNMLKDICKNGDNNACDIVAWGFKSSYKRFDYTKYDIIVCNSGKSQYCKKSGIKEISKKTGHSNDFFENSCEKGSGAGCSILGDLYSKTSNNDGDMKKTVHFYKKGCEFGDINSCQKIIKILQTNKNIQSLSQIGKYSKKIEVFKTIK